MITIELTVKTTIPLEVEGITPCTVRELALPEIQKLEVFEGNNRATLGDFFRVEGNPSDEEMRFVGDMSGVHWIGTKMESGKITIDGNGGRHIGSEMSGGQIEVLGDASDWVGPEMKGGKIHIRGRAGHLVGAAYRGSPSGMRGGTILVDGDAGNEIGHSLRRGTIAIGGDIGDLAGFNMLAGTILIGGSMGIRHGAGMKRGTLIFLAEEKPEMLPTFVSGGRQRPLMTTMLSRELKDVGFKKADKLIADFDVYHGDQIEGGRGEILIRV